MKRHNWVCLGLVLLLVVGGGAYVAGGLLDGRLNGGDTPSPEYLHVSRVDETAPDARTVAFSNLTADQQRVFESALDGSEEIPPGVDERVWVENRYVQYRDRTYEVAVAVGE